MINKITDTDEQTLNTWTTGTTGSEILTTLNQDNVIFEGSEITLPEAKFTNITQALDWVKKQGDILKQKQREDNSEALKEILEIIDFIAKVYAKGETNYWEQSQVDEVKNFLKDYKWRINDFISEVVVWRKEGPLNESGGWGNSAQEFEARWWVKWETLQWEALINAFKKDCQNLENIKSGYTRVHTASMLFAMIRNVYEEKKKSTSSL